MDHEKSQIIEVLKELSEAFGVSGFEEEVRERIRTRVAPFVDEIHSDPLGNLHAVLNPGASFTVMLDAHMDEVGFVVKAIEEGGFLRLAPIGGWDVRLLPGQTIMVRGTGGECHHGLVGSIPPHVQEGEDRSRVLGWKDIFVDVATRDAAELRKMGIRVGSPAVIPQALRVLGDGTVMAKALDDRAGCAVLVRTLESLARDRPRGRVVVTFSSSEEVGCRGARVAAERWAPQLAVAVEGTMATDTPGVRPDQRVSALGFGPVVTTMDKSLIVPERLVEWILGTAEGLGIPYQIKTPLMGFTDGGAIQLSGTGVLTAVIAVPCRYSHSPTCLMRLDDFVHTQRLLEALVRDAAAIFEEIQS